MKPAIAWAVLAAIISATAANAAHWTLEPQSKLGFSVVWSAEPLAGEFKRWKADIDFDPADLAHAHVVATIETGSVVTDYPDGDDGLKGALGFAADRFPTARYETKSFRQMPDGSFLANGQLTIRGISRPLALPFKLSIQGNKAHMTGKTTLLRTDFGVGQGEWAAPQPVAHQVTVTVDLVATKR
jgi:polyisoprenoid-binding protein YceI